ncbi:dihydrolipoyl dehydrogenase [Candidatus Mycoplasma mahonii]|nr:dihydrolipoyl dehydrogenase [Candidatus Mycoplasma mahonii]WKX02453.1 dihydrolipoyl dehydrogenase [Candidatus Mycoplasma mahonii]
MYKFKFADIGEGLHEGGVGEIYVKVGDKIEEGDSLFSVETDKVTSDIPSPVTGKVLAVLIKQGETVTVGDEIFHFEADGGETTEDANKEVTPKKEDSGAASVVGEVKISDDLFSTNMFGTKKEAENVQVESPSVTKNTSIPEFDIKSIKPIGTGEQVDVVVVGAGPGGYTAAEFIAKQGLKTVIIEKEFAGGVCLNVGCIPTKTLLKSAKVLEQIKEAQSFGIDVDYKSLSLNWDKMQVRKNEVRMKLRRGIESLMKFNKVELILDEAKVIDKHNVKVGNRTFTTKVIILATGSSPIHLPLPGFNSPEAKKVLINSTGALDLKAIPKTLTIIGGGVIGTEFAVLYQDLGTKVTIIEGLPEVLSVMDGDIKEFAHKMLVDKGINIILNAKVQKFENGSIVYEQDGKEHKIKSEKVLESVGRRANNLGLDKTLGIKLGKRGEFLVNDTLQTSIPNIFSIGDSNAVIMLAHVAYKHAHVVANFIEGKHTEWDINRVPSCVYTHPELSSIGKTEEQLKIEGIDYIKSVWQNVNVGRVLTDTKNAKGFTKLLIGKKYGEILGAHVVNNNSSDMISEIATLIETEGTVYELAATIHPHPSTSEVIYEAAIHAVDQLNKLRK